MSPTVPEFTGLLRALTNENVEFVIVGGFAMILHGATYLTHDLDFAISAEHADVSAVVRAQLAPEVHRLELHSIE